MNSTLLILLGAILVAVGIVGFFSGKVVAGSRGLKPNYYSRDNNPALYYLFVIAYLVIGLIVILKST